MKGVSLTLKEQSLISPQKSIWVRLHTQQQYFEKLKTVGYLRLKLRVFVVVDYSDMRISYFVVKYLREDEKVSETVSACSYMYCIRRISN